MSENMYNILVVEDDEVDRINIERAFKKGRIINTLYFAKDGQEALDLIHAKQVKIPLLILLDLNMPRMNGIDFLKNLRATPGWETVPVVVLTTSNMEKDKVDAYNMMVAGYVVKPVELSDFIDAVSRIGSYWSLCEFPQRRSV
jgi:CheY-like chemotaxis protein